MLDQTTRAGDLPELYQTEWCPASRWAEAHRLKAIKARKRELEEAARCLEPVTH